MAIFFSLECLYHLRVDLKIKSVGFCFVYLCTILGQRLSVVVELSPWVVLGNMPFV